MIRRFGEASFLVELDDDRAAQALAGSLIDDPVPGVLEAVPGLASVLVEFDPAVADPAIELARRVASPRMAPGAARHRSIPVVYGGEHGPDLASVAELSGMSEADVVAMHAGTEQRVLFIGFAPGFAYLGDLPEPLDVPRLATPRTGTPAGAVAIAGRMSGIYPAPLPGGWRVIGRTPLTLFDPRRDPPAYLAPGDIVRFEPMDAAAWDERAAGDW